VDSTLQTQSVQKQKIKAIIQVGSRDFGRCPLASHLPTALWPVAGKPVLERLLNHLAEEGITDVVVCSSEDRTVLSKSIRVDKRLKIKFLDEPLPAGTAGSIRDATGDEKDKLLLIFPAGMVYPPNIDVLLNAHTEGRADLTIMFDPDYHDDKQTGQISGIYVCNPDLLTYIPKGGYSDIKEGLIPEMLRAGKTAYAAKLPHHIGDFRDRQGYLRSVSNCLFENVWESSGDFKQHVGTDSQIVHTSVNAKVDPGTRICGSVIVMSGARISSGAVVIGPTIIGENVSIGKNSIVINSVIWSCAQIGRNCRVQQCVMERYAVLPRNTVVEDQSILFRSKTILGRSAARVSGIARDETNKFQHISKSHINEINMKLPDWAQINGKNISILFAFGAVLVAFFWSYFLGLIDLWDLWQRSDEYSSGLLVPFLSIYILLSRRHDIAKCQIKPCIWWGLVAFCIAQAVRFVGLFLMYNSAERLSITLTVGALVLLLFGWQIFRKVATVLLFLCLMLPLPNQVQAAVAQPLQRWATSSAVFCLETVGYEVVREGNVIHIGDSSVAVAEACNGLRMVTAFFVISGLVVLLVKRTWWEKLIVLLSSLPIALLCNTVRLSVTAVFFTILEGEGWEQVFHDFGGYAMMPLALAAIIAELWLLGRLTMLPDEKEAIINARQSR
jgi:exosortase